MIPPHSICYVFSHLYSTAQITNIQPFHFITGQTSTHNSSQVPRTQSTLLAAVAHLHTPESSPSWWQPGISLSSQGEQQTNQSTAVGTRMTCCPHTSSYYTLRSCTLSLTTLATKQNKFKNLVATCYHCACNLYTGFPTTQSLPPPQPLDVCQLTTLLLPTHRSLFTYYS